MGAGPYSATLKTEGRQDGDAAPETTAPYALVNDIAKGYPRAAADLR